MIFSRCLFQSFSHLIVVTSIPLFFPFDVYESYWSK